MVFFKFNFVFVVIEPSLGLLVPYRYHIDFDNITYSRLRRPKQQPQQQPHVSDLLPLSPRAYNWGAGQSRVPGGEAEICLCQEGADQTEATIRAHRWSR